MRACMKETFAEFEQKARFVWLRLFPMLMEATGGDVQSAAYERCEDAETVVVEFADGHSQRVGVGGSLMDIARDVMEAVRCA